MCVDIEYAYEHQYTHSAHHGACTNTATKVNAQIDINANIDIHIITIVYDCKTGQKIQPKQTYQSTETRTDRREQHA